jgi:D-threo-aldose 1-dehydrogenase
MCYGAGVQRDSVEQEPLTGRLPRRRLGRLDMELTVLGLGGASLGLIRDRDTSAAERGEIAAATVRRAVELGINYIDTSPLYQSGVAERSLGIALGELSAAQRACLHLSTKVGTRPGMEGRYDRASVHASLEQSREALRQEYLDIVFVHDPQSEQHVEAILGPGGAADAILELKQEGSVGALGLGVRTHRWQRRCIEDGRFDVVLLPYDYSLARDSARPLIELAQARGVGVVNASPYLRGLLAGPDPAAQARYGAQEPQDVAAAAAIHAWCGERGVDVGALAMQFSIRHHGIASTLVGSRDGAEIAASYRHATASLADGVWQDLAAAAATFPAAAPGGETGIVE